MNAGSVAGVLGGALVLGIGVPWLGVRMLLPVLESVEGARAVNYRGRSVVHGLGLAWLLWAGSAMVGGVLAGWLPEVTTLPLLAVAGALSLVAFALGLVDDAFGSGASKGFKGHLSALAAGRLTTGGLKLIGIGAASVVVALVVSQVAPWGPIFDGQQISWGRIAYALVAAGAIALTSNFVNLTDLRPGRALKAYSLLAVAGVVSVAFGLARSETGVDLDTVPWLDAAGFALFLAGPVVATARYDLSERGMLGDAGANPMGAVAGLLVVSGLPVWLLGLYAALMLALNMASERVSFSRLIERSAVLSAIDAWGRDPSSSIDQVGTPEDTPDR